MVDKEMIATSTAIEEAVLRMDVRMRSYTSHHPSSHTTSWTTLDGAHPELVSFFDFHYAGDHEPSKEGDQRHQAGGQPEVIMHYDE